MSLVATFPSSGPIDTPPANCCDSPPIIRFSIRAHGPGAWYWETRTLEGVRQACGLAPTRKLAAALVIRQIVRTRAPEGVASHAAARAA